MSPMFIILLLSLMTASCLSFTTRSVSHRNLQVAWTTRKDDASLLLQSCSKKSTVRSSSLLIAGTTIGGGFLALPRATSPLGFLPSCLGLFLSWLYLLSSALTLVDATLLTEEILKINKANLSVPAISATSSLPSFSSLSLSASGDETISIFRTAQVAFGANTAALVSIMFLILMTSTLVAQLSKSGATAVEILPGGLSSGSYVFMFATVMSLITYANGSRFAEKTNSFLTTVMMASFVTILGFAMRIGDVSRLIHCDWLSLLPSSQVWAIPVLLQLLVYTEVVPFISKCLEGDRPRIRRSIVIGSFIPLCMCILWTAAALAVVPFSRSSTLLDPVKILLADNFKHNYLKYAVLLLALSAISTTIIGSLLTVTLFLEDIFSINKIESMNYKRIVSLSIRILSILPCAVIAATGGESLYYAATAFAGAIPVTFLWGLFPPVCFLRLHSILVHMGKKKAMSTSSTVLSWINIALSCLMLVVNTGGIFGSKKT